MQSKNNNSIKRLISSLSKKAVILSLFILLTILCFIAFRSDNNTFIVYNGDAKTVYNSELSTTADFINESGIVIGEDEYFDMPETVTGRSVEIYIRKKNVLTVKVDGEEKTLYALNGQTVSDILSEHGITLGTDDKISVPLTSDASDGLEFEITRIALSTVEETASIPFTTEKRSTASLDKGKSRVVQNGVAGSKKLVYSVKTENGKEVSRELVSEEVLTQPVMKIVEQGTRVPDTSGTVKTWSGETLQYKKVLNMTATAYTTERSSDKVTATGQVARVGLVAVDPKVIPLGSKLYIVAANGKSWCYGKAVAADTGVRGNKIDLFFNTYNECISFGRKKATVYVLK